MATTIYFRDLAQGTTYADYWSGAQETLLSDSAGGQVPMFMSTSRGAAAISLSRTVAAGPTSGFGIPGGRLWVTAPLAADVTISGSITANLRMKEGSAAGNAGAQLLILRINSVGALGATVLNSEKGTELGTAEAAENWSAAPTSTAFNKGDRIGLYVAVNDAGGTLAVNTCTFYFDGPTAAASGDSFVTFTETLTFLTTDPSGTTLYPTGTTSEVNPNGGDPKEIWTTQGASDAVATTNTVNGYTSPIQATATAGGSFIEWFTRRLQAFTLGGVVKARVKVQESAAVANVCPRLEIAICDNNGANPVVWAATTDDRESTTSPTWGTRNFYLAGDDTSVTDGFRLRFRYYGDDTPAAAQASGNTFSFGFNGAAGGNGDSALIFTQTLAEFTGGGAAVALDPMGMSGFFGA